MDQRKDLLVEVGLEELPHSFILNAVRDFESYFTRNLSDYKINFDKVKTYTTPRRLTLFIRNVMVKQDDYIIEKRGPSVEKAYTGEGEPSRALTGFIRGNNIDIEDIVIKESNNGRYVFLLRDIKGRNTQELLPEILDRTLKSMSFPKTMKWEKTGFSFARPIRWILYLFGDKAVRYIIADVSSSIYTFGHRAYGNKKIMVENPGEYEKKLEAGFVIPDRSIRKERIKTQIENIIIEKGLAVHEDASGLYDTNTDLTEYPHTVLCKFDPRFLDLPAEVLISEMIEHQHYFPLKSKKDDKLSNYFMVVSNIEDSSETINGYQRVLRARFNDGAFFYKEDKKRKYSEYLNTLKTVIFHEKIGSMYEKVERIHKIAEVLSGLLSLDESTGSFIYKAAGLCKNDLVTLMVNEFPNLQGIMGYYYSLAAGNSEEVACAVKEHYYPRFAADVLPSGIEGAVVGMADRLDTITGIFSIGIKPKGSKDPFALRRNVFAIVKIIIGLRLNFSMRELISRIVPIYSGIGETSGLYVEIEGFIKNRIKSIFEDMGFLYDEIDASLANVMDDIYEAYRRVLAIHEFRSDSDFEDLLISFKRMSNIIMGEDRFSFSKKLLMEKEEKELYNYFISIKDKIVQNIAVKNYNQVYSILSTFKPYVDNFFDNVLVMEKDLKLRGNRMGLLNSIISVFSDIIDISKIVSV